jgi:predicted enzyme related to lactoylglutathione lyase
MWPTDTPSATRSAVITNERASRICRCLLLASKLTVGNEGRIAMLRGISTMNLWADDLAAATRWYAELLAMEPYFSSEAAGRGPGYVEFRIGDYSCELGIIDRRFAPAGLIAGPGGAIVYWHVDDVAVTVDRLMKMGAKQLEPLTERGPGFVTASVIDPFDNVLGIMHNRHYLEIFNARP